MIHIVQSKRDLKNFVYFTKQLYQDHPFYVFPIFKVLIKELSPLILKKKSYKAILAIKEGKIAGRILYTVEYNKKKSMNTCYFSSFDCINDVSIGKELFGYMETDVKNQNISYCEGTFTPYDPDTRRGIMVQGFDDFPAILTSYNYAYYGDLIENCGYIKAYDTFAIKAEINQDVEKKLKTIETYFLNHYDVRIDEFKKNKLNQEIVDIHTILLTATTDLNYQEAPSIEMIKQVARSLKPLINTKLIRIARENGTNNPVGFCLVFPDFNQILRITKGKIKPLTFLLNMKMITKVRGTMQYVIPKYQNSGLIGYMYKKVYDHFSELGISEFEGGTMMEDNPKSYHAFDKFGGKVEKIYRIYGKEI